MEAEIMLGSVTRQRLVKTEVLVSAVVRKVERELVEAL
jgi:hypothetical protein